MKTSLDITLLQPHMQRLKDLFAKSGNMEASAYVFFGVSRIAADPWDTSPRLRLVSHRIEEIDEVEKISASQLHVTWGTRGFMKMLCIAQAGELVPGIVHSHPGAHAYFSAQDDSNEAELARTAANKGLLGLASIVLGGDDSVCGRLWQSASSAVNAISVRAVGRRFRRWPIPKCDEDAAAHLERQARLFGIEFNPSIRTLKVAVVGLGGTGSAVAILLARLGVGHILLIDKDIADCTNLNRVHGARRKDVKARRRKVEILRREIERAGLGVRVTIYEGWGTDPAIRDGLKSSDFVFGCTDDHGGRILLNRLAYFYGIPVIDLGLRMAPWRNNAGHDINGRVTTLVPGNPCLICGKIVNAKRAAEEALQRADPKEFEKRKKEAYVIGAGDPAPAVVTFTTEMGSVAVNELIAAITGFHGEVGMVPTRYRRFHLRDDRFLAYTKSPTCPVCNSESYWGRGDLEPFLDMIGG